jgi:hypothetical protein
MYANGQGVPVNLSEAYFWLAVSAKTWTGSHQEEAARARDLVAGHLNAADLEAENQRVNRWLGGQNR